MMWGHRFYLWLRYRDAVRARKWSVAYDALAEIEMQRKLYGE